MKFLGDVGKFGLSSIEIAIPTFLLSLPFVVIPEGNLCLHLLLLVFVRVQQPQFGSRGVLLKM